METGFRLGFLVSIVSSLVLGWLLLEGLAIIPVLEDLLSLDEVSFYTLWILNGLAGGLIFIFSLGLFRGIWRSIQVYRRERLQQTSS